MRSLLSPRLLSPIAVIAGLLVQLPQAAASDCAGEPAQRWNAERSWPSSCELGVPTDGFVLLEGNALSADAPGGEGELQVFVQRVSAGEVLETFLGQVASTGPTSALFRSERPLLANADYVIVARRVAADGSPSGASYTSAFSTGSEALAPISFRHPAELQLESFQNELKRCTNDACGKAHCEATGESAQARLVRIAVPPIDGGITQQPYALSAKLTLSASGQAPAVATSDTVATQAGKRSFIVIELPPLASLTEGCVTLTAKDVAGHETQLEAGCLELSADASAIVEVSAEVVPPQPTPTPASEESATAASVAVGAIEEVDSFEQSVDAVGADEDGAVAAEAEGCAVGPARGQLGSFAWLALALTLTRLRSRKRHPHA
jgi:hypothetical protein